MACNECNELLGRAACKKRQEEIDELKSATDPYYLASIENLRKEIERLNNAYDDLWAKCGDEDGIRILGNSILQRDIKERDELIREAIPFAEYYKEHEDYLILNWLEKAKKILGVGG